MTINTSTPTSTTISRACFGLILAVAVLGGASCDSKVVEGSVESHKGERLPGVVVTVDGTRFQAMSNAQGVYKVRHGGAPVVLHFFKTGYAPGILEPSVPEEGRIEAESLQLWRLPVSHGVWLYDNFNYTRARPVEPESVILSNQTVTFGVRRLSDVETDVDIPFIVIYGRLPTYNISLTKLDEVEAPLEDLPDQTATFWVPVRDIPISARPLDKPEGKLIHVRLFEPLEPGNYAVHWGALRELSPMDSRAYLFKKLGDDPEGLAAPETSDEAEGVPSADESEIVDFEDEPMEAADEPDAEENP